MPQPVTDYNVRRYSNRWVLALLPLAWATAGCGALGSLGGGGIGGGLNLASALISFVLDLPNPIDVELQAPAQATASLGVISERQLGRNILARAVFRFEFPAEAATLGPDGRIYYAERVTGRVLAIDPAT